MKLSLLSVIGFTAFFSADYAHATSELTYDTKTYCEKIVAFSEGNNPKMVEQCMREETTAKEELAAMEIDEQAVTHCLDVVDTSQILKLGGSYTILKTCLDNEMESIARYQGKTYQGSEQKHGSVVRKKSKKD